jgi:hypothetical protein
VPKSRVLKEIQDSWEIETGERPTRVGADMILDQMCEAFYQQWAGAGPEYALRRMPDTAAYLAGVWTGEDGDRLRAAMRERGVSLA